MELPLAGAFGLNTGSDRVLEQWSDGKPQYFEFLKQFIHRPLGVIQHSNTPVLRHQVGDSTSYPQPGLRSQFINMRTKRK